MNQNISKVGLGTVQWGCNYGISNNDGQTPIDEVKNILQLAKNAGISIQILHLSMALLKVFWVNLIFTI